MTHPTDWCWDPMPAVDGWFAVVRCWDLDEGMFPDAVWVEGGKVGPHDSGGMMADGSQHAGPFATKAEALKWGCDHDPEDTSWRGQAPAPAKVDSL